MTQLQEHLVLVQEISTRVQNFREDEASDLKSFSKSVVDDLGVLADAVSELIARATD